MFIKWVVGKVSSIRQKSSLVTKCRMSYLKLIIDSRLKLIIIYLKFFNTLYMLIYPLQVKPEENGDNIKIKDSRQYIFKKY